MYRIASITAFDVLETIHISVVVKLWDGIQTGSPASEFTRVVDVMGAGSSEDEEWLKDALVAVIEAL